MSKSSNIDIYLIKSIWPTLGHFMYFFKHSHQYNNKATCRDRVISTGSKEAVSRELGMFAVCILFSFIFDCINSLSNITLLYFADWWCPHRILWRLLARQFYTKRMREATLLHIGHVWVDMLKCSGKFNRSTWDLNQDNFKSELITFLSSSEFLVMYWVWDWEGDTSYLHNNLVADRSIVWLKFTFWWYPYISLTYTRYFIVTFVQANLKRPDLFQPDLWPAFSLECPSSNVYS